MKSKIISLSLLLGFSYGISHAKPHTKFHKKKDNIKFGIAAGATVTDLNYFIERCRWTFYGEDNSKVITSKLIRKARWGFHANAFIAYQLLQHLDLKFIIKYVTKGNRPIHYIGKTNRAKINLYDAERCETERYEGNLNFNYLQTTVQLNIFPGKDRQFFLFTSIYAGYLLTAKNQTQHYIHNKKQGEPETMNFKENTSTKDKLNSIDIGIALGLGYEFKIGLIVSVTESTGLRKIVEDDDNMKWTNLASQLSLGYNFAKLLK